MLSLAPKTPAAVFVPPHTIEVDRADTLSQVLDQRFPDRHWTLWGPHGGIARVAARNPQISDVNKLKIGMLIDIRDAQAMDEKMPILSQAAEVTPLPEAARHAAEAVALLPVSVREPASAAADAPLESYGIITVAPEFSFVRINVTDRATGGTAVYLSDLSPGLRFGWSQHWSNQLQSFFTYHRRTESYAAPQNVDLQNAKLSLSEFGLGFRFRLNEKNRLAFETGLNFRQEIFAHSPSLTTTHLDSMVIPEFKLGLRYLIFEVSPFAVSLHASGSALLPAGGADYNISAGVATDGGLALTENFTKHLQMSGDLRYVGQRQNTTIAEVSRAEIQFTLSFAYRLDAIAASGELRRGDLP